MPDELASDNPNDKTYISHEFPGQRRIIVTLKEMH
jgi:hypothetical protein